MACKFSCFLNFSDALKVNDVGIFESDNGDQYQVKYRSNVCRDLLLKIEWKIPKQVLVTVKLYNTTFKRCFSSKGILVNGKKIFMKLRGAFNISNSRDYKVLCVINLIPYVKFSKFKDLPSDSEDSVFKEPESQCLSVDGSGAVMHKEIKSRKEDIKESKDISSNSTAKIHQLKIQSECKNSEPVIDSRYQECLSGENDFVLDENALANGIKMKEFNSEISKSCTSEEIKSEMSVLVTKKDIPNTCDKSDKIIKNSNIYESSGRILKSGQILENEFNTLENNFIEISDVKLINESNMNVQKSMSSNDTSSEMNVFAESKSQYVSVNGKSLTLDNCGEEVMTNMDTNIHKDLESKDIFGENNTAMDVDFTELSSENSSVSHDEENLSGNIDLKINEVFLSNNISSEINPAVEVEFHALLENKDRLHDADGTVITAADMILGSNDVSVRKNEILENHLQTSSNYNICPYIQNLDPLKIHNNDIQSPIVRSKSPLINIHGTSEVFEDTEIYNKVIDSYKVDSENLPSSIKPPNVRGESPLINIHRTPEVIEDTEMNNREIDSHKAASQNLLPSKTSLVFQTLVRTLSTADSDLELTDINEEAASSSEVRIKNSLELNVYSEKNFPIMESELKGLSMDMLDLLTSGDLADAIITNGEKHIKVHRAIVSARSSALKEVFTKHRQDDVKYRAAVQIPSYVLEDVIIFLYVGLIYIKSTKMAQDVYQVAERYRINDLMDICSKHVSK